MTLHARYFDKDDLVLLKNKFENASLKPVLYEEYTRARLDAARDRSAAGRKAKGDVIKNFRKDLVDIEYPKEIKIIVEEEAPFPPRGSPPKDTVPAQSEEKPSLTPKESPPKDFIPPQSTEKPTLPPKECSPKDTVPTQSEESPSLPLKESSPKDTIPTQLEESPCLPPKENPLSPRKNRRSTVTQRNSSRPRKKKSRTRKEQKNTSPPAESAGNEELYAHPGGTADNDANDNSMSAMDEGETPIRADDKMEDQPQSKACEEDDGIVL
jgi:hypothetical protein